MPIRSSKASHLPLLLVFAIGCSSSSSEKPPAAPAPASVSPAPAPPPAPEPQPEAAAGPEGQAEEKNEYQLEGSGPELYEQILVPPLFTPWADDLIKRAKIKPGEKILDVATGTGIVARRVAEAVGPSGAVTALDINPGMLAVAKKSPAPDKPAIEWVEGDAQKLPFPDRKFNAVFCQEAMQFFPDRKKAVREMYRVLAPGGRVALSSWRAPEHNPYGIEFAKVVEKKVSAKAAAETRSPFGWDDKEEMVQMLKSAGFKKVRAEAVTIDMKEADLRRFVINDLLSYPTTGKAIANWSDKDKEALVDEILKALEKYKTDDGWKIPWAANVAVAYR
jgi:ubiquinone/menaquinone biosynthesis C-methylase UbiE